MKLLSFKYQGRSTYGVLAAHDSVVELGNGQLPEAPDLKSFLPLNGAARATAAAMLRPPIPIADIDFLPVIPNPEKIFCVGSNYDGHREEAGRSLAGHPAVFLRLASSQTGHDRPIHLSHVSKDLDYEGELAVIIGSAGRHIKEQDALDYVAGYSCYNDGSFRDWQLHTHQITPGKNFPESGALGPYLVTPDEIHDLNALRLQTRLNGKVMQSATVAEMIFSVQQIIAYVSAFTPLAVGDVIATGTPGGVGFLRDPKLFMKAGDVVEIEIDSVGILRNRIGIAI
jgi:2-keto-4-pentenoate hydratase/2-oxohepta-3-ene-1,7-dioic acid hydratase in catechol pathway